MLEVVDLFKEAASGGRCVAGMMSRKKPELGRSVKRFSVTRRLLTRFWRGMTES